MKRGTILVLAVLAVVGLGALLWGRSGMNGTGGARAFKTEPEVTVVLDKATGKKKTMGIEEYIQGVVGGEMGQLPAEGGKKQDWPVQAYAAQAILARSFALNTLSTKKNFEIATDVTEAQAYNPDNITPTIQKAVRMTRGEVMTNNGQYVKAWFHSYSGGQTATAKEGLNYQKPEPPYIKSVTVPDNAYVPKDKKSWTVDVPLAQIQQKLAANGVNVGNITDVRMDKKGPSGRVTQMTLVGSGGSKTIHGADFRVNVDPEMIKSMKLSEMKVVGDKLRLTGSGFGHGVGLSQWDAFNLAKQGKSPEEIIKYFFQGIEIRQLWK